MNHKGVSSLHWSISVAKQDINVVDLSHDSLHQYFLFLVLELLLNLGLVFLRSIFNYLFLLLLTQVLFLLFFLLLQLHSIDLHANRVIAGIQEIVSSRLRVNQCQSQQIFMHLPGVVYLLVASQFRVEDEVVENPLIIVVNRNQNLFVMLPEMPKDAWHFFVAEFDMVGLTGQDVGLHHIAVHLALFGQTFQLQGITSLVFQGWKFEIDWNPFSDPNILLHLGVVRINRGIRRNRLQTIL